MIKQKIKTKCGQFLMCFLILWTTYSAAENRVFSLRLKQAPMVATLQQLALEQNANLMIDDELEGTLSLQLDNVDFDRLLRSVAKIKGLSFYQENDIYYSVTFFDKTENSDEIIKGFVNSKPIN